MLKSRLSYISLLIAYRSPKNIELPEFQGSTIRGVFGRALKSAFCVMHHRDCGICMVKDSCGYFDIFESIDGESILKSKGMERKPHPYILVPPEKNIYLENEIFFFRMTVLGENHSRIPYLLYAFQKMGELGFGKSREKMELYSVKDATTGNIIMEKEKYHRENLGIYVLQNSFQDTKIPDSLILKWVTPVKLMRNGNIVRKIDSESFRRAMYRRYTMIHKVYGILDESDMEDLPSLEIETLSGEIKEWKRYSNRQNRSLKMEGLTGMLRVFPKTMKNFFLIQCLTKLHLGKATAFGQGRFKLRGVYAGSILM